VSIRLDIDVGCALLLSPSGLVDSGVVFVPACSGEFFGVSTESYQVRMKIAPSYDESLAVTFHLSGTRQYVTFPGTALVDRGWLAVSCSTALSTDLYDGIDELADSVLVRVRDIAVTRIVAPVDTVPDATWLHPECIVRNLGSVNEPVIPVVFRIGTWVDTAMVYNLAPGGFTSLVMNDSLLSSPGIWLDVASADLPGDLNPSNNTRLDTFWVLGTIAHDVGPVEILAPTGSFDRTQVVTPSASVTNYGTGTESFWVYFSGINQTTRTREYFDSAYVASLVSGAVDTVDFTSASFPVPGPYEARCSTFLVPDQNITNDVITGAFTVTDLQQDPGVSAILAPVGYVATNTLVAPRATWHNYGTTNPANFTAWFFLTSPSLGRVYAESTVIAVLAVGRDTTLTFATYNVGTDTGAWVARCSTYASGDVNLVNNVREQGFTVGTRPPWPYGWAEVGAMPALPSGKQVKDGGWLAYNSGDQLIYSGKGNKTPDFYSFDAINNRWTQLSLIPDGTEAKKPSKGAVGCADGAGIVYATKGNNTDGFYKYVAAVDSWYPLAPVPAGTTGKKVKGGTDLVYVPPDSVAPAYVYLLKGYKNEFWRYDLAADTWTALASAPADKWDKGSWLAYDGVGQLYAHQSKYHGFYAYNLGTGAWGAALQGMPLVSRTGKKKKSKDGGSGAYSDPYIYALKGGNTQEYWKYYVAGDSWQESDTVPLIGSTQKKKKVKAGV